MTGGQLDLGVVGEARFDPALHVQPFRQDRLALILSPSHPLARKGELAPEELAREPFVLREPGSNTRAVLERALHERGIEPRVAMELGSMEAIKRTVSAGLGIAFVPECSVGLEQAAGALAVKPVWGLDLHRGLFIIRRASLHLTLLHQRLLAALRPGGAAPG